MRTVKGYSPTDVIGQNGTTVLKKKEKKRITSHRKSSRLSYFASFSPALLEYAYCHALARMKEFSDRTFPCVIKARRLRLRRKVHREIRSVETR